MPKMIRSICQFCHTNCGIIVSTDEYGNLSVKGDPDHPVNRGGLCVKAAAIPEIIHSPDRLKHPLQRTRSGFRKISWNDALDIAAENLRSITKKYGPGTLVRCNGAPVSYECRDGFLELMGTIGSPNLTGAANLCMVPRMTAFRSVTGMPRPEPDYEKTDFVILWGANPLESERFAAYSAYDGFHSLLPRLKQRGVPIYCLDPYRTDTAKEADKWIYLNPGSDSALGLSMIHVIINEELYDKAFVTDFTSGFSELKDHIQQYTPEWASGITGIPLDEIIELSKRYASAKSAVIHDGNGLDMYANGVDSVRTIAILICLTGNLDAPGGNVFFPFAQQSSLPTNKPSVNERIWYDRFPLFGEVPFPAIKESVLNEEEQRPRAMIVHHGNPVLTQANENRTRRFFEKLEFVMVNDIYPTATTDMADLVLPMTSAYESYGYRAYSSAQGGFLALARPATSPVGESRSVFKVEHELAERMGLAKNYPFYDDRSWVTFMVKSCGIDFEKLLQQQIVFATEAVVYKKYQDQGFSTSTNKINLFSEDFKRHQLPAMPGYSEPAGKPLEWRSIACNFPLIASSYRPGRYVHTKFKNIKSLNKNYPAPRAHINPDDANSRDIRTDDEITVTSTQGSTHFSAYVTNNIKPGLIWLDFGWGNPTDRKGSINLLTDDTYYDPVSGATPNRLFQCEIRKHGR